MKKILSSLLSLFVSFHLFSCLFHKKTRVFFCNIKFSSVSIIMMFSSTSSTFSSLSFLLWLSCSTTTTTLCVSGFQIPEASQVKSAGGGIPIVPSGDRHLFDPSEEGMLGGTNNLNARLMEGFNYHHADGSDFGGTSGIVGTTSAYTTAPIAGDNTLLDAQHWLEDYPIGGVPTVYAKASKPAIATVLGRIPLLNPYDNIGDIQHIVLKLPNDFKYVEGQSLSVIPPGIDSKTGKPHKPRLYSIASTRYGDICDGQTISLCVRRAEYKDPITGIIDPTKAGICSNFLCNTNVGDQVQIAGPVGKTMLLPSSLDSNNMEEPKNTDLILVATGTGIAPFRGFLHRLFIEQTVVKHMYSGRCWLIFGVPTTNGILYNDEFNAMMSETKKLSSTFELDIVKSREQFNSMNGGKKYVQHVLMEESNKVFERLENGAHIYFCGLKGMMPGILDALELVATSKGLDWSTKLKQYQKNGQWHVEVY